jgi:Transposase
LVAGGGFEPPTFEPPTFDFIKSSASSDLSTLGSANDQGLGREEAEHADHPSVQQIAWVDSETGECGERRLTHSGGEAEQFYRELKKKGISVRVGMEATGHSRWFERLLAELNSELWVGDPAQIRAKRVRKQKNDRRDAEHLLKLMLENNFPRIWVPTPENRDVRQLVLHRHRLVGMRTRVMNQLQAIAMNEGVRRKRGLWTEKLPIGLSVLVVIGLLLFFTRHLCPDRYTGLAIVLAALLLFLLVLSLGSTCGGIRHALPVVVLLAVLGGVRHSDGLRLEFDVFEGCCGNSTCCRSSIRSACHASVGVLQRDHRRCEEWISLLQR